MNGRLQQIPDGTTVAELLELLQCEARHVAVEVNMELVPRGRHTEHRLAGGDRLEIVTLVGGG